MTILPGDGAWNFTWTTGPYGWLGQVTSGWVLVGRPNAAPETGWVVAHDVFHHDPEDTGTYREEVMTFGAETWLAEPGESEEDLASSLATSWHGVMMLVLENGTRGAAGLMLKAAGHPGTGAMVEDPIAHPMAKVWTCAYRMALDETRDSHEGLAEIEQWARLGSEKQVAAALALVARGYDAARARWPDVERTRKMFAKVEKAAGPANDGDRLHVQIQVGRLSIEKTPAPGVAMRAPGMGR